MKFQEVFSSIQGEGPFVGTPTYFIRTLGCDLDCSWCDTINTRRPTTFELSPREFVMEHKHEIENHKVVSITGGEPTKWGGEFLELVELLSNQGHSVCVESHLMTPQARYILGELISKNPEVWLSLSPKLPSSGEYDAQSFEWSLEFINKAISKGVGLYVKYVVQTLHDLETLKDHKALEVECCVVLQPETLQATNEVINACVDTACSSERDARVIPQVHHFLRLR